jgi:uncharacterized membrane protein YhhN
LKELWLLIGAILAPINWVVSERRITYAVYFTKPAVMVALLAWLWNSGGTNSSLLAFFIGALLCLAGDIFLLQPDKWFLAGLVAFLSGHIGYMVGFKPTQASFWPFGLPLAAALGLIGVTIFRVLAAGLQSKGLTRLRIPIFVYILIICGMALSALLTLSNPGWQKAPAVLVSIGALLFMAADSLLGWNRFIRPVAHERFIGMMIYHLAQFGIIIGAAWNFT